MRHATQRRFSVVRFFFSREKKLQEGNIQKKRKQTELKEKKEWKAVGRNEWNENQRRKHKLVRVCVSRLAAAPPPYFVVMCACCPSLWPPEPLFAPGRLFSSQNVLHNTLRIQTSLFNWIHMHFYRKPWQTRPVWFHHSYVNVFLAKHGDRLFYQHELWM